MAIRFLTALLVSVLVAGSVAAAQWRYGQPVRIVLLVDSSFAVGPLLTPFRAGLHDFLDGLPQEPDTDPEIVMISTGGGLRIRVGPTTDRAQLHAAASSFASDGGGNAFLDSLLEADERFLRSVPDHRWIIVILTTDLHTNLGEVRVDLYNRFANTFLSRGGRAHAVVVRSLRTGATTQMAEHLTRNSGGFYETVVNASAVPKVMRTLAEYVAADL